MPHLLYKDTIAAAATPAGAGGIAIIRISGPKALEILSVLFIPPKKPFSFTPRYLHYGHVKDLNDEVLDEVLAVYMPAPHSATGEDVAEIHCHGGTAIVVALLEAVFATGARPASAGEFTRRSFLNGRMDLAQAEAVAELISAPSRQGVRLAKSKLDGIFSQRITKLRSALDALRIQITLAVDFPDEEAELLSYTAFAETVEKAQGQIVELLASFKRARLWREGAQIALIGHVNVGKSSLLNAFLGRPRAIVSDEPGTTRDYIEENISLQGLPVRIFDTAGLREGGDIVEAEGIQRTRELAKTADLLLLVIDASTGLRKEDNDFLLAHSTAVLAGNVFCVLNKSDLEPKMLSPLNKTELLAHCPSYAVSAKTGAGLEPLQLAIRKHLLQKSSLATSNIIQEDTSDLAPNLRQAHLLESALNELKAIAMDVAAALPPEIISVRLEATVAFLDEITGTSTGEELLDKIFSSFCIGK